MSIDAMFEARSQIGRPGFHVPLVPFEADGAILEESALARTDEGAEHGDRRVGHHAVALECDARRRAYRMLRHAGPLSRRCAGSQDHSKYRSGRHQSSCSKVRCLPAQFSSALRVSSCEYASNRRSIFFISMSPIACCRRRALLRTRTISRRVTSFARSAIPWLRRSAVRFWRKMLTDPSRNTQRSLPRRSSCVQSGVERPSDVVGPCQNGA